MFKESVVNYIYIEVLPIFLQLMLVIMHFYLQIALNNAENATDYIARLTSALQTELKSLVSQKSQHEKEKVDNCLAGLPAVGIKLKAVLEQVITFIS